MSEKQQTEKQKFEEQIKEMVNVIKQIETLINQSVTESELKAQILPLIEKEKLLIFAYKEVLRLSKVVILYDFKSEKQRGYFKSLYIKEINKIFN